MMWISSKTYGHNEGLSCCFRQWVSAPSHCAKLHGYALSVKIEFGADYLDARNWVMDFGGLKEVKAWLHETFDHTTIISVDDPLLDFFKDLESKGAIDLRVFDGVGCEKFAEHIFRKIGFMIGEMAAGRVRVLSVEVREHSGNSATYRNPNV